MTRYRIEQALVSVFGMLLGLSLAMFIVPGDVGLWVVIAIVLALFCRAFFIRGFCGELIWPMPHRHGHAEQPVRRRT
jgi:hypothetical protein